MRPRAKVAAAPAALALAVESKPLGLGPGALGWARAQLDIRKIEARKNMSALLECRLLLATLQEQNAGFDLGDEPLGLVVEAVLRGVPVPLDEYWKKYDPLRAAVLHKLAVLQQEAVAKPEALIELPAAFLAHISLPEWAVELKKKGAIDKEINEKEGTFFLQSAIFGYTSQCLVLAAAGANVAAVDALGHTAAHWAVIHQDLAQLLIVLASGTPAETADVFGKTPLQYAVWLNDAAAAQLLLLFGANPFNAAAADGQDAYTLAWGEKRAKMLTLFESVLAFHSRL